MSSALYIHVLKRLHITVNLNAFLSASASNNEYSIVDYNSFTNHKLRYLVILTRKAIASPY